MTEQWYYARGQERIGPMNLEELVRQLPAAQGERTLVYGSGMSAWVEAFREPRVMAAMRGGSPGMASMGAPPIPSGRSSDEIDYEIFGEEMQYVEVTLDPGEMVIAEAGAMMYMTSGIKMETVFGDPSAPKDTGFWSKVVTAGKRAINGESLFMTTFANAAAGRHQVSFASPYPGKILPMHLDQLGGELICQKDAFVC